MENDGGNGEIRIKQLQDVFNNSTTPLAAKLLEDLYLKTENTKDSNIILKGKTQGMYLLKRIKTQDSKGEFFIPNKFLGKDKFFPSPKMKIHILMALTLIVLIYILNGIS